MEESIREINLKEREQKEKAAEKECRKEEARNYSPLVLAFLGDSVYEREIRERIVREGNASPNELNRRSSLLAKASTQAAMAQALLSELTDEEVAIYRRGRNANPHTMAKNATVADYRRATGLEALMGYLFLCGEEARCRELIGRGIEKTKDVQ
ncbi:MAG: ribonuclease III [Lachnospiraceae bacterium]|nr:ribonuclease III [Lachnospiraceae bacterium]